MSTRCHWFGDLVSVAGLAALTVLFFWRILFTDQALFWGDIIMWFYPAQNLWAQSVRAADLPLWNPYILNGFPHFADPQAATFYPTMLLNLVFPIHRALAIDIALHVFLFALLTWAFLRRQGLGRDAAFYGALILAFSGFLAVRVTQPTLLRSLAWMPLVFIAAERASVRPKDGRTVASIAVVLALQLLGGHLQTVLISTLLVLALGVWRTVRRDSRGGPSQSVLSFGAAFAAAAGLALVLAAVQVLPALEFAKYSDRSEGTDLTFAASFSFPVRQLPMLFSPRLFGSPGDGLYWGEWLYWEMVGYFGLVSLLLAVVGLILSRRRDRIFWAAAGLSGVAVALGRVSPLYQLLYWLVPGVPYFRVPARFLLWYGWGVAVLAAYGLESLRSPETSPRGWRATLAIFVAIGVFAMYWAAGGPAVVPILQYLAKGAMQSSTYLPENLRQAAVAMVEKVGLAEGRRFAVLLTATALVILGSRWRRIAPRPAAALLVLIGGVDLFSFGMNFYPTVSVEELSRPPRTERLLDLREGRYRLLTTPSFAFGTWGRHMTYDFGIRSSADLQQFRAALVPNINAERHLPNIMGYTPLGLTRMNQVLNLAFSQAQRRVGRSPLIDFMGGRYLLTRANLGLSYQKVYEGSFFIWRNDDALPRGYLVTEYTVQSSDEEVGAILMGEWDPRRLVVLDRAPADTFGLRPIRDPGVITRQSYGPTKLTFDLILSRPAIFVLSDTFYPGWKAYVDGRPQPIYRANHAFRAVVLPAAARRLEFVFQPTVIVVGGIVSGVGWAGLVTLLAASAVSVWKRRQGSFATSHAGTMSRYQIQRGSRDTPEPTLSSLQAERLGHIEVEP